MKSSIAAISLVALCLSSAAYADGDAGAGKKVFRQCAVSIRQRRERHYSVHRCSALWGDLRQAYRAFRIRTR